MEIPIDYRFYKKKNKYVCLRSIGEERHFTIVHIAPINKNKLSNEEWNDINHQLQDYLKKNDWTLHFQLVKPCENCTYGYFEQGFEDLIQSIREKYKGIISIDHDIPDYDEKYIAEHGAPRKMWAHIAHSRGTNTKLSKFLKAGQGILKLRVRVRVKRSD